MVREHLPWQALVELQGEPAIELAKKVAINHAEAEWPDVMTALGRVIRGYDTYAAMAEDGITTVEELYARAFAEV